MYYIVHRTQTYTPYERILYARARRQLILLAFRDHERRSRARSCRHMMPEMRVEGRVRFTFTAITLDTAPPAKRHNHKSACLRARTAALSLMMALPSGAGALILIHHANEPNNANGRRR